MLVEAETMGAFKRLLDRQHGYAGNGGEYIMYRQGRLV